MPETTDDASAAWKLLEHSSDIPALRAYKRLYPEHSSLADLRLMLLKDHVVPERPERSPAVKELADDDWKEAWQVLKHSNDKTALRKFKDYYPKHGALADLRLTLLEDQPAAKEALMEDLKGLRAEGGQTEQGATLARSKVLGECECRCLEEEQEEQGTRHQVAENERDRYICGTWAKLRVVCRPAGGGTQGGWVRGQPEGGQVPQYGHVRRVQGSRTPRI